MKNLTTTQIASLTIDQVQALTNDQIVGLTIDQIVGLTNEQIAAFTPDQIGAMTIEQEMYLSNPHVRAHAQSGKNFSKTFADSGLSQNQLNRLAHDVTRARGRARGR